jgi:hypothetical protein
MRAIHPEDWATGEPTEDGEYLCLVRVPENTHGSRTRPAYWRYLSLEYAGGGFWIRNGLPIGMVKCWIKLNPPGPSAVENHTLPKVFGGCPACAARSKQSTSGKPVAMEETIARYARTVT